MRNYNKPCTIPFAWGERAGLGRSSCLFSYLNARMLVCPIRFVDSNEMVYHQPSVLQPTEYYAMLYCPQVLRGAANRSIVTVVSTLVANLLNHIHVAQAFLHMPRPFSPCLDLPPRAHTFPMPRPSRAVACETINVLIYGHELLGLHSRLCQIEAHSQAPHPRPGMLLQAEAGGLLYLCICLAPAVNSIHEPRGWVEGVTLCEPMPPFSLLKGVHHVKVACLCGIHSLSLMLMSFALPSLQVYTVPEAATILQGYVTL